MQSSANVNPTPGDAASCKRKQEEKEEHVASSEKEKQHERWPRSPPTKRPRVVANQAKGSAHAQIEELNQIRYQIDEGTTPPPPP